MWLVAVVERCLAGCEHYSAHTAGCEHYSAHTAGFEHYSAQILQGRTIHQMYTKCSNTVFDLLKMGIIMPETC